MSLPQIGSYGEYSSGNYGAHTLKVVVGKVTVWFSYKTPVAFYTPESGRVVHKNDWGVTTGKHLNWIDEDKKSRVNSERFKELWEIHVESVFEANQKPLLSRKDKKSILADLEKLVA